MNPYSFMGKKLAPILLMMGGLFTTSRGRKIDLTGRPAVRPVPKGCKRWYFDCVGETLESSSVIFFDALTFDRAEKKYKRWQAANCEQ